MRRITGMMLGCAALLALAVAVSTASGASRTNFFAIDEIGVGSRGYVSLTNFTDVPASLAGLYLCQGARCTALPRVKVGAGRTVRVATFSGKGLRNVVARNAGFGPLRPGDGEIAMSTARRVTARSLLTYLQWGKAKHALTPLAVKAGLWVAGAYAPTDAKAVRLYRMQSGLWVFE